MHGRSGREMIRSSDRLPRMCAGTIIEISAIGRDVIVRYLLLSGISRAVSHDGSS